MKKFDIGIVGSGPGGYRAAVLAALRGKKVAIIEKGVWGGTCLNRGCVPKKDWHETAKWIENSRYHEQRGITGGPLQGNLRLAWEHQQRVVGTVRQSYVDYLRRLGVQLFHGTGHFQSPREITISGEAQEETIRVERAIIATGSSPVLPSGVSGIPGRVLHSDMLFDGGVPGGNRVVLVGGGVIGTEFAYIFTQLGMDVTWLVHSRPLDRSQYSSQAKETLEESLRALGIVPRTGFSITAAGADAAGAWVQDAAGEKVHGDWILLATGRLPQTCGLGLGNTAVTLDGLGFIQTDTHLECGEPGVYAIGDAVGPMMTANQALADATIAVRNILDGNIHEREPLWVPELVYSAVELARLGMNDEQAEDAGFEPAVGFSAFKTSPRALGQDDPQGFVRILADMDSGELLGGEIVGREAGELIHLLAQGGSREEALGRLAAMRFNHPARAEEILNATETLAARWGLAEQIFGSGN